MQKTKEAAMLKHAISFNTNLKLLTKQLGVLYPTDPRIYRATTRIMTALSILPGAVIETAGPYLYKYHETIFNPDVSEALKFFTQNNFDKELETSNSEEDATMIQYIIMKTKMVVADMTEDKKKQYMQIVIELLDDYIDYMAEKPAQ